MMSTLTIARRELGSIFRMPVGWIVIALFAFLSAVVFVSVTLAPGEPASLRYFFRTSAWLLIPIAPAISMRLLSDEFRSGTIECLRTAPVTDAAVVWGKFLGAAAFLVLMLVPTAVFPAVLWLVASPSPDPGPILAGYLGLVLVGSLYLSIGTLASVLTSSQTLAFLGTLMFLVLVMVIASMAPDYAGSTVKAWLVKLSVPIRVDELAKGVVDTTNIAFFVGTSVWFLVLATMALEARRWR